jgi:serine/threonine protein kinase
MSMSGTSSSLSLISLGGIGAIYRLNALVVVKVPRDKEEPDHATEQSVFDTLERYPAHPHLLRSFLRLPGATFLECLPGGDLASLLRIQQTRDPETQQVLAVAKLQPLQLCLRWMKELSSATAWLEEIGLAHGDIRPPNMLLDSQNHVKLGDFDRSVKAGECLDSGTEPFARLLGEEGGRDCGSYGKAGPRTEQFALGSVIYSLTRGYDPFEDRWFGRDHGPILIEMFQKKKFPPLTGSNLDTIIQQCWGGEFATVKQLSGVIQAFDSGWDEQIRAESMEWFTERQAECQEMVTNGLLTPLRI